MTPSIVAGFLRMLTGAQPRGSAANSSVHGCTANHCSHTRWTNDLVGAASEIRRLPARSLLAITGVRAGSGAISQPDLQCHPD